MCWGMCILWWLLGTAGLAPGIFLITLYPLQCALALLLAKLNKQASVSILSANSRYICSLPEKCEMFILRGPVLKVQWMDF